MDEANKAALLQVFAEKLRQLLNNTLNLGLSVDEICEVAESVLQNRWDTPYV